jgi:hypothetical protein
LKQGAIRLLMAFQEMHFVDLGYFSPTTLLYYCSSSVAGFSHSCIVNAEGFTQ